MFTDIDDCHGSMDMCNGNGICIDGVNSFTCNCFERYEGPNCTKGIYTYTYIYIYSIW